MAGEDVAGLLARLRGQPPQKDISETSLPAPEEPQASAETSTDVQEKLALPPPPGKAKTAKKPPAPVTPSAFLDLPGPEPVEATLVDSLPDLQALVERWLANPPKLVGLDLETTGLSPLRGARIRTVQIQAEGEPCCWVADVWAIGERWAETLAPLFRLYATTWVAHNAAFEVEHLAAAGIQFLSPIRCTLIAAHLLSRGILPTPLRTRSRGSGLDLASCCGRMLQIQVDKEQQVSDWESPTLSSEQLAYAALDAHLALDLWKLQLPRLVEAGMERVHQIESQALPAVAEARLTGLCLPSGSGAGGGEREQPETGGGRRGSQRPRTTHHSRGEQVRGGAGDAAHLCAGPRTGPSQGSPGHPEERPDIPGQLGGPG